MIRLSKWYQLDAYADVEALVSLHAVKEELTVKNNVLPTILHTRAIEHAHEGHQGHQRQCVVPGIGSMTECLHKCKWLVTISEYIFVVRYRPANTCL